MVEEFEEEKLKQFWKVLTEAKKRNCLILSEMQERLEKLQEKGIKDSIVLQKFKKQLDALKVLEEIQELEKQIESIKRAIKSNEDRIEEITPIYKEANESITG